MRVLHLEDSDPDAELLSERLTGVWPDCRIQRAITKADYLAALRHGDFDLILSDYSLHDMDGLAALELARTHCPTHPFIFFSGTIGEERAIEALKNGADDYVIKDRPTRLISAIERALSRHEAAKRHARTEEALRQNQKNFHQITENVADIILMLDPTGRCLYRNPAYATALGHEVPVHGHDIFADIHPDDRETVRGAFRDTLVDGTATRLEYRIARRDGSTRILELQTSVIRDTFGSVSQVLFLARDVTARRAAEEKLRYQAELLDRTSDAILVLDPQARVIYWNHGAELLYSLASGHALGREIGELGIVGATPPDAAREQALARGEWEGELSQRSADGRDLTVASRWTRLVDLAGRPEGILIINTDITRRKQIEAGLEQAQRMESLGLLAGGVAHDMNNMLMPIISGAELAETVLPPDHPVRTHIKLIRQSARHGAQLVRQLLDFSRGSPGVHQPIVPRRLLEDFLGFLRPILSSGVELTLLPSDISGELAGDETQLRQVLLNLCLNARDAMNKQGRIELSARDVRYGADNPPPVADLPEGPYLVISVADTGPGIPPDVLRRIFDPFFTTKPKGKGTGLGLSTSLGIVRGHGGHLEAANRPEGGAVFRLHLPLKAGAPATRIIRDTDSAAPSRPAGNAFDGYILVVDDDNDVRQTLCAIIERLGFKTLAAGSLCEAIETNALHRDKIRLLLTDALMPGGSGFELIAALRAASPRLPCVVLSGLGATAEFQRRAAESHVLLIAKPPPTDLLHQTITQALGRSAHS